jgi:OOP family OmpA-OmpF porin
MSREHEGREPVRTMGARALGHTRLAALAAAGLVSVAALPEAEAQVKTFYLDRIQVAGAPDDGVSVWRPEMSEKVRIFGQLGFGFALNPFRVENHVDGERERNDAGARIGTPIEAAFSGYVHAGVDFLKRFQFQVSLPVTLYQGGKGTANSNLAYASDTTSVSSTVANDMRFELRGVPFFTRDRFFKTGLNAALWAPTGDKLSYGGDGSTSGGLGLAAEIDAKKAFVTLNAFFHFRPYGAVNAFAVQDEFRWALGGYVPVRDGLLRLGLNIFGNTSLNGNQNNASQTKRNFARDANTPLEWQARGPHDARRQEARRTSAPGRRHAAHARLLARFPRDAARGLLLHHRRHRSEEPGEEAPRAAAEGAADTDKDGIPDDIDLCPTVPEDKKPPNTDDGCPGIDDRDGDGIPDSKRQVPRRP